MNNIWKTNDIKARKLLNNCVIMGYEINEISENVIIGEAYYLITQSKLDYILYIPEEVSNITDNSKFRHVRGTLRVYGGEGLTSINGLFEKLILNELDLTNFNTSNCRRMNLVFMNSYIKDIKFGKNWNMSKVENAESLFFDLNNHIFNNDKYKIKIDLDLRDWDVRHIKSLRRMFSALGVKSLNISNWKIGMYSYIDDMLADIKADTLDISNMSLRWLNSDKIFGTHSIMALHTEIKRLIISKEDFESDNMSKALKILGCAPEIILK